MRNPFALYSPDDRELAVRFGVVGDTACLLDVTVSKISRIFLGKAVRAETHIVRAINKWLKERNMPIAVAKPDLGAMRKVA